jgi:RNA polymerase sigma-70 factor (ECF subfamily)
MSCEQVKTHGAGDSELEARFQRDVLPLTDQLLAAAFRLTRNTQDAEDLAQETVLRAYVGFVSYRDGTNLRGWLYRILHNTWISQHRKQRHRPDTTSVERLPDAQLAAAVIRAPAAARSAEDIALDGIVDSEIRTAFLALQEDVRRTVYYADVLSFSREEIAALTDSPMGTVMSRLHRGRKRLRGALQEMAGERGLAPAAERSDTWQVA